MKINTLYQGNYFIAEGIDTSGKTTQLNLARDYFSRKGVETLITRQPGGTAIGQKIREILLDSENIDLVPEAEVLLYMSDRVQHMQETIIPALEKRKLVLQDRGQYATRSYQAFGRQLGTRDIDLLHENIVIKEYSPDSVLFFDISVKEMEKRLGIRNASLNMEKDRLELEDRNFFQRIREGMYECHKQQPDLITIINGERPIEVIQKDVIEHIKELIEAKSKMFK